MFDNWDERFDMMCGAAIKNCESAAMVDSGVHDLLYGEAERTDNTDRVIKLIAHRSGHLPNGNEAVTVH